MQLQVVVSSLFFSIVWAAVRQLGIDCGVEMVSCPMIPGIGEVSKCLYAFEFCNGVHDCPNGADEDPQFCYATFFLNQKVGSQWRNLDHKLEKLVAPPPTHHYHHNYQGYHHRRSQHNRKGNRL